MLDRCVKRHLKNYLEKHTILSHCQFGFRKRLNLSDNLLAMNNHIMEQLNKNKKSITVFADLAKAFDTVDHTRLIDKLT